MKCKSTGAKNKGIVAKRGNSKKASAASVKKGLGAAKQGVAKLAKVKF